MSVLFGFSRASRHSRGLQRLYVGVAPQYIRKRMEHDATTEEVLNDLNRLDTHELKDFKNIGLERAKRLVAYRKEVGKLISVEELENVDGFGKMAITSIQKNGLVKRKTRKRSYILKDAVAKEVKSITGIGIGRNEIYWCLISRDCEVMRWSSNQFEQDRKYIPENFVQQVGEAISHIPKSDITVVEAQTHKSSSRDPFLFPLILKNKLTEAVIHALSKQPSVSFNPNIVKRYFKLKERFNKQFHSRPFVESLLKELKRQKGKPHEFEGNIDLMNSCSEYSNMVESFIDNQTDTLETDFNDLKINKELVENFKKHKQKDGFANVLLLAYGFLKIEILRQQQSF